ncbi:hypothetical protein SUGI_0872620 [Cryptomeria japonica]|uniref:auxin-induced protein 15A-like n=1 Tax=Cryptomeria japonica TaxID=3369 RepID=UPI0024149EBD|nr:auxin-induced protein 15A-like [Cryptomeria japonica]GLJ42140.1 hypothetical protein SUGI_0872620 [Cryptomeria japonica]
MKSLAKKLQRLARKTHMSSSMRSSSVPPGFLPVYVGKEGHRFVVDVNFLSHPLFEELLELSAEELGYSHKGGLRVACNIRIFEYLLSLLNSRNPSAHYLQITDLLNQFSG